MSHLTYQFSVTINIDLHPGNIILLNADNAATTSLNNTTTNPNKISTNSSPIQLAFIDAGITITLAESNRRNFIELFHAVVRNNGQAVGQLMIEKSRGQRPVLQPDVFIAKIAKIVSDVNQQGLTLQHIKMGDLLQQVLECCYQHQVKLESKFVSVVLAIGVLEGLGIRLDPELDLIKVATPYIIQAAAGLQLTGVNSVPTED